MAEHIYAFVCPDCRHLATKQESPGFSRGEHVNSVTELGEDGGRWLVTDVTDVNAARVSVLRLLREQLLPGDPECFAGEVDALLDAEVHVYHYPICVRPETERLYYQSPVGHGAPLAEWIAGSGVTFGMPLLPDQRDNGGEQHG